MKRRKKIKRKKKAKGGKLFLTCLLLLVLAIVLILKLPPVLYPATYNNVVQSSAKENNIDPMLVFALIKAESNFNKDAVSASGAVGLMQLMPDTASWISNKMGIDYEEAELTDVRTNIKLGTWYLSYLLNEYDNDVALAVVAYNAGYGNVNEWLKNGVWDGTLEDSSNIPYEESRDYLRRVLANYDKYKSLYD